MSPLLLPVAAQAFEAKGQNARGEVGIKLAVGQDQKPAVVDHKAEAAGTLARRPAQPLFARFDLEGRGAEAKASCSHARISALPRIPRRHGCVCRSADFQFSLSYRQLEISISSALSKMLELAAEPQNTIPGYSRLKV